MEEAGRFPELAAGGSLWCFSENKTKEINITYRVSINYDLDRLIFGKNLVNMFTDSSLARKLVIILGAMLVYVYVIICNLLLD